MPVPAPAPAPVSESECVVCVCIVCAASMAAVGEMPSVPIMGTAAMRDNFSPSKQRISLLLLLRSFPLEEPFTRLDRSRRRPDESVSNFVFYSPSIAVVGDREATHVVVASIQLALVRGAN